MGLQPSVLSPLLLVRGTYRSENTVNVFILYDLAYFLKVV